MSYYSSVDTKERRRKKTCNTSSSLWDFVFVFFFKVLYNQNPSSYIGKAFGALHVSFTKFSTNLLSLLSWFAFLCHNYHTHKSYVLRTTSNYRIPFQLQVKKHNALTEMHLHFSNISLNRRKLLLQLNSSLIITLSYQFIRGWEGLVTLFEQRRSVGTKKCQPIWSWQMFTFVRHFFYT